MGKIVKINKKEKKLEINYFDFLVYVLLLTTLLVLSHSIKNYCFTVSYIELTYSLFLLPFIYKNHPKYGKIIKAVQRRIYMLELRDICFEVDGKHILNHINLTIEDHQLYVITGPNGGGK